MMTCREVCENAQDYSDNKVSRLTRVRIKLHTLMCNNCRNFIKQTAQANLLIRQSFRKITDKSVSPKLMAAFHENKK